MITHYDVAIIGAGPSGNACALALQGSGLKVVLVDKESFPRDKVCGDAIPGGAFRAMDAIKPEWGQAMRQFSNKADIHSSAIIATNRKKVTHRWTLNSYNSKRLDFDNFLFQLVRSDTETVIFENARLQKASVGLDSVHCEFDNGTVFNASIVIGCDGANSVVKRQLYKYEKKSEHSCAAVRAYVQNVEGMEAGVNEFYFFKGLLPGYFWIFPLENGWANIGFGILETKHARKEKQVNLRDTLNKIISIMPETAPRFKNAKLMTDIAGFPLPLGTQQTLASGERFMLCGDAASLIDPLQGHGIDKAMWSGVIAAKQAVDCFKKGDFSADFISDYDTRLYKKLGPELARNTQIMKTLMRFPWLISFVTRLGQNQKFTSRMARLFKI